MEKVLITGATGLVGKHLAETLSTKGYQVEILVRSKNNPLPYKSYVWDYTKNYIEEGALENASIIIHLAGANIGKRWTRKYQQELVDSRIDSVQFLFEQIKKQKNPLQTFISANGAGYYGQITTERIFDESNPNGTDFIGKLCFDWENKANQFEQLGCRVVSIRTATVLSAKGGALEMLTMPIKYRIGAVLGSGKQYFPWIHLNDLIELYVKAVMDETMQGAFNAAAPDHITNKELTYKLAKQLNRKIWLPHIPAFVLRLVLGRMAVIVLEGSRVSSEKIQKQGFHFKYDTIEKAFNDLIH